MADSSRFHGFDVARSLAILGMVIVHFSLVMGTGRGESGWMDVLLACLDGRATATFVILAGVGVTLMTRRAVASGDAAAIAAVRRSLVRRGLFLLVLGFINMTIWPGDILRVYGVSMLLVAPLVTASDRRLLLCAASYELFFILLFCTLDFDNHWEWSTMTYRGLCTTEGIVRNLFYDGFRSVFPWTGLICFGMWLGRLDLSDPSMNRRIGLTGLATAVAAEITSFFAVAHLKQHPHGISVEVIKAIFGTESMPALPLFLAASGGIAVAIIAACVWLVSVLPSRIWWPLAVTGQMALTWYMAHIVFGLGTIVAVDQVNSQPLVIAAVWGVCFFATAVAISSLWKWKYQHGPLEWILRKVCS